eukprot:3194282-Rhodomonas_salina.3
MTGESKSTCCHAMRQEASQDTGSPTARHRTRSQPARLYTCSPHAQGPARSRHLSCGSCEVERALAAHPNTRLT